MIMAMYAALAAVVLLALRKSVNDDNAGRRRSVAGRLGSVFLPQRAIVASSRRIASRSRGDVNGKV